MTRNATTWYQPYLSYLSYPSYLVYSPNAYSASTVRM